MTENSSVQNDKHHKGVSESRKPMDRSKQARSAFLSRCVYDREDPSVSPVMRQLLTHLRVPSYLFSLLGQNNWLDKPGCILQSTREMTPAFNRTFGWIVPPEDCIVLLTNAMSSKFVHTSECLSDGLLRRLTQLSFPRHSRAENNDVLMMPNHTIHGSNYLYLRTPGERKEMEYVHTVICGDSRY